MIAITTFNKTAPVLIPIALFIFLAIGLLYPVCDYVISRRKARLANSPMPGIASLFQELMRSQFLAIFCFLAGIMILIYGTLALLARDRMNGIAALYTLLVIMLGFGLLIASQVINRRFISWSRAWRAKIPK